VTAARRLGLLAGAVLLSALTAGCQHQYVPMSVYVRDRDTRDPVPGATVEVRNTSLLNPARPDAASGETDIEGHIRLRVARYNRLIMTITAPEHQRHVFNADHPAGIGDSEWFGPSVNEAGTRATIQVRLTP